MRGFSGFTFAAVATAVASLTLIFGACSSVPDITYTDETTGTDSSSSGTSGGDGSSSGNPSDARDVVTDCKATGPEVCDDGIDNDCNGDIDCADPACNPTHQCVPQAPVGFELTAVSDVRTVTCANGYTDQVDLEMLPSNPTCQCTCADNGGTCTDGTGDVTVADNGSCTGGTTRALNRNQVACAAIPGGNVPVGNNMSRFEMSVAATKPATCDVSVALTGTTPLLGRTCKPPVSATAGGCPPTQVCVRRPPQDFAICATRPTPDAGAAPTCAGAYSLRRRAGTTISGALNCDVSGCTCGNADCGGTFTIYDTANCSAAGKVEVINAGASCTAMSISGGSWTAVAYKATATGGCSVTASPQPQGSLDIANESTVCCRP